MYVCRYASDFMQETVKDVPLVKFMHLVFTCMPGENYARQFRSVLLCPLLLMWCLPSTVNIYQQQQQQKMEALLIHSNMFWSWFYSEHAQHSSLYQ